MNAIIEHGWRVNGFYVLNIYGEDKYTPVIRAYFDSRYSAERAAEQYEIPEDKIEYIEDLKC